MGIGPIRVAYAALTPTGIGNQIMVYAKAHLIAETCGMRLQRPIWPRIEVEAEPDLTGYGDYFPWTKLDRVRWELMRYHYRIQRKLRVQVLPSLMFTRHHYADSGIVDVGEAALAFLKLRGLDDPDRSVILGTSGKWGGYAGIHRARSWILRTFEEHPTARDRLRELEDRIPPGLRVAVHIRWHPRHRTEPIRRGEQNVQLPVEWYTRVCRMLREACPSAFVLLTDAPEEAMRPFLEELRPVHTMGLARRDLLDVLLMARSELIVCSNSTYSRLGVFLNDRPYVWCGDALFDDETGRFGYLYTKDVRPVTVADTTDPEAVRRCFAVPEGVERLPEGLRRYVESSGRAPIDVPADLIYGDPAALLSGGSGSA